MKYKKLTMPQRAALKHLISFGNDGLCSTGNKNTDNALYARGLIELKDGRFYPTLTGRALEKLL